MMYGASLQSYAPNYDFTDPVRNAVYDAYNTYTRYKNGLIIDLPELFLTLMRAYEKAKNEQIEFQFNKVMNDDSSSI